MLILVIENYLAARDRFICLIVVLDMVGAQALVAIVNIDGSVGKGDVALASLRSARRKLGDAPFAGLTNLLRARRRYTEESESRGCYCKRE